MVDCTVMFTHQKSVDERDAKYLQVGLCDQLHVRENRQRTGLLSTPLVDEHNLNRLGSVHCQVVCPVPVTLSSSVALESTFDAGIITYVSSAYLHNAFPGVTAVRSQQ